MQRRSRILIEKAVVGIKDTVIVPVTYRNCAFLSQSQTQVRYCILYGHSGHGATLPDTTDNLIPAERFGDSRAERLTVKTAR